MHNFGWKICSSSPLLCWSHFLFIFHGFYFCEELFSFSIWTCRSDSFRIFQKFEITNWPKLWNSRGQLITLSSFNRLWPSCRLDINIFHGVDSVLVSLKYSKIYALSMMTCSGGWFSCSSASYSPYEIARKIWDDLWMLDTRSQIAASSYTRICFWYLFEAEWTGKLSFGHDR